MTPDDESELCSVLDTCDVALADKPCLSRVYPPAWRAKLRARALALSSADDFVAPEAYLWPASVGGHLRTDYQSRLEDGLRIAEARLPGDMAQFRSRLRQCNDNGTSAGDELLLVRGFVRPFGENSIAETGAKPNEARAEFLVNAGPVTLAVEVAGLGPHRRFREWQWAWRPGMPSHAYTMREGAMQGEVARLRKVLARKLLAKKSVHPLILVLAQYWIHPEPERVYPMLEHVLSDPASFKVPGAPLAICYVAYRVVYGIWFRPDAGQSFGSGTIADIERALRASFYALNQP
jgi:hypothetical protein